MADNPFERFAIHQDIQPPSNPFNRFVVERPEPVGNIKAGLEGVAQGVTFGFADEIEGGIKSAYHKLTGDSRSLSDLYADAVARARERVKAAKDTNPAAFYTGEIGSSLAVPGGLAKLGVKGALANASGRGLGARTVAGAKEGAAYGAISGAGHADSGVEATLGGAASGAALGGVIGAALPGAVDAVSNVARAATAPIRAAINPEGFSANKMAEAAARDLSRVDNQAGAYAARLRDRFAEMSSVTPSVRVMDVGGENMRGLMRAAANVPNQQRETARRALDARQNNQWSRIESSANEALAPGQVFQKTVDDLIASRDQKAATLFKVAFQTETPTTQKLIDVLNRPTMQSVGSKVERRLLDEGKELLPSNKTEWLHRIKLEIDDLIGMSKRAEQMGNTPQAGFDTKTLVTLKNDFLNAIDNKPYKYALRQFAGPSALKTAAEQAEANFMKMSAEEVKATLGKLSASEQEMFRLGAKQALFHRLEQGASTRDLTDGVFAAPAMQKKLAELFPDRQSFRKFQKSLVVEAKMADSRKAMQGNSTTAKQLAEGEQAGKDSRLVMSAVNAAMKPSMERAMSFLGQAHSRMSGISPSVANELIRMGMSKDPAVINQIARQAAERAALIPVRRARVSEGLMAGGSVGAGGY